MDGKELAPKVKALYQAVIALLMEGADLNNITVAEIAAKAGIGKGTVYEYFPNKEEMIAGALFYQVKTECRELYERIDGMEDLSEKMNLVLASMEKKMAEINCFVRVMHIMLDSSAISTRMRKMAEEKEEEDILIVDVIRRMIDDGSGTLEKIPKEKRCYLQMSVFSRLICYVLYQFDPRAKTGMDSEKMRALICRDVCREIEALKEEK